MFTVSDTVTNAGTAPGPLYNYGRVTRFDKPRHASIYVLHEGLIGVIGEEGLQEVDLFDRSRKTSRSRRASRPTAGSASPTNTGPPRSFRRAGSLSSRASPISPMAGRAIRPTSCAMRSRSRPGQSASVETLVFAGAKEVGTIDAYEADRNIRQFDLLIDWGWFYFITKPMFYLIDYALQAARQFRPRHPRHHGDRQGSSSSRSPTSPTRRWRT